MPLETPFFYAPSVVRGDAPTLDLKPVKQDIELWRYAPLDFVTQCNVINNDGSIGDPLDLTFYTAEGFVWRKNVDGSQRVIDTLTSANGRIVLGGATGMITFRWDLDKVADTENWGPELLYVLGLFDPTPRKRHVIAGYVITREELVTVDRPRVY